MGSGFVDFDQAHEIAIHLQDAGEQARLKQRVLDFHGADVRGYIEARIAWCDCRGSVRMVWKGVNGVVEIIGGRAGGIAARG